MRCVRLPLPRTREDLDRVERGPRCLLCTHRLHRPARSHPRCLARDSTRSCAIHRVRESHAAHASQRVSWTCHRSKRSRARGRGGYCFEQNGLLRAVLREIGVRSDGAARRAFSGAAGRRDRMRSHMLLKVEVGGEPYLVDVGFGGQTPTGPLRFTPDLEQVTPHEPFRLVALEGLADRR